MLSALLVIAKTYQHSRGAVPAAHLAPYSSWQALPVSREWLGWRRPNQPCCNLHLIDECLESVETPVRNKTVAVKELEMCCFTYLLPPEYNQENLEGLTVKRNLKDPFYIHSQLKADSILMFAMFCNVDWKTFILQKFYLFKFKIKICFLSKGRNINHLYYHFGHSSWL